MSVSATSTMTAWGLDASKTDTVVVPTTATTTTPATATAVTAATAVATTATVASGAAGAAGTAGAAGVGPSATVDPAVRALCSTLVTKLYQLLMDKGSVDASLLVAALEFAETAPALSGTQKKQLVVCALQGLAAAVSSDPRFGSTVQGLASLAAQSIDLIVGTTKPVDAAAAGAQLFTAITNIERAVAAARGEGLHLDGQAIATLIPTIITTLSSLSYFAAASTQEQTVLVTDLLTRLRDTAPADEQPAWNLAILGVGPIVATLGLAVQGGLKVNAAVQSCTTQCFAWCKPK